jgi:hypothetical protein
LLLLVLLVLLVIVRGANFDDGTKEAQRGDRKAR